MRLLEPSARAVVRAEMNTTGAELVAAMEAGAPRDKGDLAEAAHYKVSNDGLGLSAGYSNRPGFKRAWQSHGFVAVFQEFGTRHHAAHPFIRPAYRKVIPAALDRIDAAVASAIRKAAAS